MDRLSTPLRLARSLEPGRPWPLGACVDGDGVNFAVFSEHATRVEVCVFDGDGEREVTRLALGERSGDVWHGRLAGAGAGLVYGLRAHGPWSPEHGQRFNPRKLLLDPWAREIVAPAGGFDWHGAHFGAAALHPAEADPQDNARQAHKARVVDDGTPPAWQRPRRALADTVLYELHVRAFTRRMPGVDAAARGTYAGLASDAALAHLVPLGVTAVSLLPVQYKLDEARLAAQGLVNHWGYNTLGFFCPEPRYAATPAPRQEFREMVRRLHAAGIEVILDIVFNHTAEGDELGPTLAWRGLDNASWYRLREADPTRYENWSGCGNTLRIGHPRVLQFVLDAMRHWVVEMGVDGFRFDLAPVLGRDATAFDAQAAFFKAVAQDPALQGVKLIAEPWDLGPGGYQLGHFPRGWLEWNDRFRDTMRAFWLGHECSRGEFALRLAGSADRFAPPRRSPLESVNFVVAHDGFNLDDLVSYNRRHNLANGEDNRDGHAHNLSWNCGVEGPSADPEVQALRGRLKRALLACVLLAQGTPMLAAGDEIGHSARGNNNPYCQDNRTTWLDWEGADASLPGYVAHLVELRRRLLPLGPDGYTGRVNPRGRHDLAWLGCGGEPMTVADWNDHAVRALGALIGSPGHGGDQLLLLFNAGAEATAFALPPGAWVAELDSAAPDGRSGWRRDATDGTAAYALAARSVVLLRDTSADTPPSGFASLPPPWNGP